MGFREVLICEYVGFFFVKSKINFNYLNKKDSLFWIERIFVIIGIFYIVKNRMLVGDSLVDFWGFFESFFYSNIVVGIFCYLVLEGSLEMMFRG